ncbi:MAG: beta-N-acetylhexosaminidase [Oscillospiraceae bacterium]|jgi:hexosaminidase|nr:beta-N-acetylhexosaminidase [Oscillospiraceae bacterium]
MVKARLALIPYPNSVEYTGGSIPAVSIDPEGASVTLCGLQDFAEDTAAEAYILHIGAEEIKIIAPQKIGVFYAKQTLQQLREAGGDVPCCKIFDQPRFAHRGFMLDVARHMTTIENTKKLIDALARMKMNVLHWHLTDDQGWRVPVEKYPRLIEVGSVRARSHFGQQKVDEPYGGFYTHDELREIVAYASARHITVIPELDIPGHMTCAIAAYPQFSCTEEQLEVGDHEGVYEDILCVGKDEVMQFVYDVLDAFCDIFPGEYFHIGGDEAPKKRWKACPHCQQRMKDNDLQNEEQLQGWFNKQVAAHLAQRGKKTVVWNEALKSGQMGDEVIAQSWFDPGRHAIRFANRGHAVIMSDNGSNYLDYPYGRIPLKKIYKYNPFRFGLTRKGRQSVLGVEAPSWAEYMRDFDRVCYMTFPRLCAVAENGWTRKKNYKDFRARAEQFVPQLVALGIYPALPGIWDPSPKTRAQETIDQAKGLYHTAMMMRHDEA